VNRGPAIWATVVALALTNVGVAATVVALMGKGMPLWVGLTVTALGVLALVGAVALWKRYLQEARAQRV